MSALSAYCPLSTYDKYTRYMLPAKVKSTEVCLFGTVRSVRSVRSALLAHLHALNKGHFKLKKGGKATIKVPSKTTTDNDTHFNVHFPKRWSGRPRRPPTVPSCSKALHGLFGTTWLTGLLPKPSPRWVAKLKFATMSVGERDIGNQTGHPRKARIASPSP